jgi:hypothetical protein
MLKSVLIPFAAIGRMLGSAVAAEKQQSGIFTGNHSKEGANGRPNTARITDGKTFLDITEQEYREQGDIQTFEGLPRRIVRRLPVRIPANEDAK